ncbi:MAG: hypothetical protein ACM3PF_05870 [Bacteroidota bacterium]
MPRTAKNQSRKSRPHHAASRAAAAVDRALVRRYLAFVRAVVGTTKPATR